MWAARLVPSHGRGFAPPSQSRLAAGHRQTAKAEGTTHALGLPRPRRTSSPRAGSRRALGLPRPKPPAIGHGLGTVKGTLAPPRYERGLEGSQERGKIVGLADGGRAGDFVDTLFGNAALGTATSCLCSKVR